ncbi:hypothetical protein L328_0122855 [Yersinia pestis 24H]|nr:hypothetical protein L328_0122855 [Yersinia pestis 24H]
MTAGHTGASVFMALTGNAKPEPDDVNGAPVAAEKISLIPLIRY